VPGLAQIPLFKYLFSSTHTELNHNEIVFLIVPHVVRTHQLDELNLRPVEAGTGNTIEMRVNRPTPGGGGGNGGSQATPPQAAPAGGATGMPSTTGQTGAAGASTGTQAGAQSTPPSPSGGAQLLFDPPVVTQAAGSTFTVNIVIAGGQNVFAVPVQIQFDPARLQLVNVSNGSFLSRDGQVVVLTHREDTGNATITAQRPPGSSGVSGDGPVYTLTFLAKSSGQSTLTMTRAALRDAQNQPIPVSASPATVIIR
jgi:general secretion pathway protein D